jgi:glycosyltransferase involved in cell wall biosynthesis
MRNKKILFFVNCSNFFCSHFYPLAKYYKNLGHEIYIVSGNQLKETKLKSEGFKFYCIGMDRSGVNALNELRVIHRLYSCIKSISPDYIHSFTVKPIIYAGFVNLCLRRNKINFINSVTGLGFTFLGEGAIGKIKKNLMKLLYRIALIKGNAKVIFENKDDLNLFISHRIVNAKQSFLVNGAGVDLSLYKSKGIFSEKLRVTMVARLLKDKGVRELIKAGQILKQNKAPVQLLLVGDCDFSNPASMKKEDIQEAHDLGYINWLGFKNDIAEVYRNTDVAILPSYREGLPKSLTEACAAGLPIITTDTPGCREVVIDGENGFLVPLKDSDSIVSKIEFFEKNRYAIEKMGQKSRALAEDKFDVNKVLDSFNDIYNF